MARALGIGWGVSIHVPLAEHDQPVGEPRRLPRVSIHVPLAEHDPGTLLTPANHDCFNSRAPRGARQGHAAVFALRIGFNSRAPRGARRADARVLADSRGFNSRAPRGARRHLYLVPQPEKAGFNSRAPRGARLVASGISAEIFSFQFTCPSRSTTYRNGKPVCTWAVSIHVPLAEHDNAVAFRACSLMSFNSRAPRGARRSARNGCAPGGRFNSRAPRGARHDEYRRSQQRIDLVSIHVPLAEHDDWCGVEDGYDPVSIHVPLAEHDVYREARYRYYSGFNSRAPRGARPPVLIPQSQKSMSFNSRAPRGARRRQRRPSGRDRRFNSRAPRGARQLLTILHKRNTQVSIHVPLAEHDLFCCSKTRRFRRFQFTCPSRSTTFRFCNHEEASIVSIHVPLAEHDFTSGNHD